jgi:hypothetical protein
MRDGLSVISNRLSVVGELKSGGAEERKLKGERWKVEGMDGMDGIVFYKNR